jgi:hypothetical protein
MKENVKAAPGSAGKLIVVLGMHRSGTSSTTRAMAALGAEFGDRLLQPIAGVNDKGFFEDVDILGINVELMNAAGVEWHAIGEIDLSKIDPVQLDAFQTRAIVTLRAKCQGRTFVLKDPRLSRLMPFWQPVFECIGVPVSYVVTVRHPISVARSLGKRDGFAEEKSYLLWLAHVVPALVDTRGHTRVIVDYDLLLDNPRGELERMATQLGLPLAAHQAEEFGREFLEEGLRHTRFHARDLDVIRSAPHSVKKLFVALQVAASTGGGEEELEAAVESGRQYMADLAPLLRLEMRVHQHIVGLNTAIAQRDQQLTQLRAAVTERDNRIAALERSLVQPKLVQGA